MSAVSNLGVGCSHFLPGELEPFFDDALVGAEGDGNPITWQISTKNSKQAMTCCEDVLLVSLAGGPCPSPHAPAALQTVHQGPVELVDLETSSKFGRLLVTFTES